MTDSMVQGVVRAIQLRLKERGAHPIPPYIINHAAVAAIEAMRDPTEAMVLDGCMMYNELGWSDVKHIWTAMIDAALKD